MNRLVVRFLVSHLAVAVVGGLTTFVVVRALAPSLFDANIRHGPGPFGTGSPGAGLGPMQGQGQGLGYGRGMGLRDSFADAVNTSLVVGALAGAAIAALVGTLAAYRLLRPLARIRSATQRMAAGEYGTAIPTPSDRELAALVTDVNTLGTALAETEGRRTRLISEVAHEMRTPLTVIDGYVEGMIDGVLPTGPAELTQVSDEVRRLRRLAEDLSSLSRAEEGRVVLVRERADVGAVARDAAERLRSQAEGAGLTLEVAGGGPQWALIDEDRVAHVASNLVGNAILACEPGDRITVRVTGDDRTVRIGVRDTGEGLDEADLRRVFERFYRVPGRRGKAHDGGSGIGLTIARGIMRAHGGDVEATSAGRGQGAEFTAWVPSADAPREPDLTVVSPASARPSPTSRLRPAPGPGRSPRRRRP